MLSRRPAGKFNSSRLIVAGMSSGRSSHERNHTTSFVGGEGLCCCSEQQKRKLVMTTATTICVSYELTRYGITLRHSRHPMCVIDKTVPCFAFRHYKARLASFGGSNWPAHLSATPESLAGVGFFFVGGTKQTG